jgi:hypothetical protein
VDRSSCLSIYSSQRICLAERWLFPSVLPKREYIPIVESVLFLTVMTGHYRLARLRISLLASTRIRRDRNPSPGLMAHCPKIKFARDRFSKLLNMCGFSHDASPLERTIAYQRLRSLGPQAQKSSSQFTMLQATYGRKYIRAVDRFSRECRYEDLLPGSITSIGKKEAARFTHPAGLEVVASH